MNLLFCNSQKITIILIMLNCDNKFNKKNRKRTFSLTKFYNSSQKFGIKSILFELNRKLIVCNSYYNNKSCKNSKMTLIR